MWTTFEDRLVPMENTLLFYGALRKYNIPSELHIYPHGPHGLALADKETSKEDGSMILEACQSWIPLAQTWLENLCK
jgi:hypothetical protein